MTARPLSAACAARHSLLLHASPSPRSAVPHAWRATALVAAALLAAGPALAQTEAEADKTLSTVVVTASGFEQAVEDAPASITVIPRQELEKKRKSSGA